jgi:mono/diheme cytochrome c family protein
LKKVTVIVFLLLLVGLMSACSNDKQTKTTAVDTNATTKDPNVITGDEVFQKSCITCHSSGNLTGGQVKLDSAKMHNDFKQEEDLTNFVQTNMPKSAPGSLSKEEYAAVAKYLWDQKQ